jgi:hypothetical protein
LNTFCRHLSEGWGPALRACKKEGRAAAFVGVKITGDSAKMIEFKSKTTKHLGA